MTLLAVLTYFAITFLLASSLTSCEKPELKSLANIPSDATLFSEIIYTEGWAQVGEFETTERGTTQIFTNGKEFITSRRADSNRHSVRPVDTDVEGYFIKDISYMLLLTREQCMFFTPKILTSEYFVL